MSIQARLAKFTALSRAKLSGSTVAIIYKGQSFSGLSRSNNLEAEKLSFADSEASLSHVTFDVADCQSEPAYGAKISINGVDRLIKSPRKKDAFGVSWTIEHVEYYSEWAIITGYVTVDGEAVEVYQQIKCRILDSEQETFNAYPDDYTQMDMTTVCIRVSDWQYAAIPQEGLKIEITGRTNLNVKKVNTVSGDYKLSCREAD